ncbi:MAG: thiamine-phosphate pyrophosphorylase [Candidatus Omnitrophota bacterium]
MKHLKINSIDRILDANINRAKEGLRVCEEITRFILNSRSLTADFKKIRHKISEAIADLPSRSRLFKSRCSLGDVGLGSQLKTEFKRSDYKDIFWANIQRVKESVRVLEEFCKLKNIKIAVRFKRIRYLVYEIEKKAAGIILKNK